MTVASSPVAPRVSVLVLAYNHEHFLPVALDDALAQATSFPYEIVVGEDRSTDGTRAVLAGYQSRHPDRIRSLLRERNLGAGANFADTLTHCRGEYVALLEGDDRWPSSEKLQRQVEFMDAHPECAFCFHDATKIDQAGREISAHYSDTPLPSRVTVDQLLAVNLIPTCSVMFRRSLLSQVPLEFMSLRMQDWPCWILLATQGNVCRLDPAWSAYRLHAGGMWSTQGAVHQHRHILGFYDVIGPFLARRPHAGRGGSWRRYRKHTVWQLIIALVVDGRWREARPLAWRYLFTLPFPALPPAGERSLLLRLLLGIPSAPMQRATPQGS